jgi:serine protease Do
LFFSAAPLHAQPSVLPETIARVKPSVLGVGTFQKTRRPPNVMLGTGFVVADGSHALTNAHVIPARLDKDHKEVLAVFAGQGAEGTVRLARVVATDKDHDLALLRFEGPKLAALKPGNDQDVREGQLFAFTGYPLGAILGLFAVTHQGIVSGITPIVIPVQHGGQLNRKLIDALGNPTPVFQLDATAYPGNSGSPMYDVNTGQVVGIINKVFVEGTKEHAITQPSGITYAIPIRWAEKLLKNAGL